MHAWIRGSETGKKNAELLNQVLANIKRNDDMAHPGAKTLFQTLSMLPNSIQIGGNYVTSSTKGVLTEGAAAFRILLDLWNRIVPQDQLWLAEMEEVRTLLRESVEESQRG